MTLYNALAWKLHEAGLYPKDAEKYTEKSIKSWNYSVYATERRAAAKEAKRREPDDAALRSGLAEERAMSVDTLGQIYAKQGRRHREPATRDWVFHLRAVLGFSGSGCTADRRPAGGAIAYCLRRSVLPSPG